MPVLKKNILAGFARISGAGRRSGRRQPASDRKRAAPPYIYASAPASASASAAAGTKPASQPAGVGQVGKPVGVGQVGR
jgi:hypothetical protein